MERMALMDTLYVTDRFIGRAKEVQEFQRWLNDPESPWILYLYDALEEETRKGGVGKTWLLHRCIELVQQAQPDIEIVMIDFFTLNDRDRIFLAEKIVQGWQRLYPAWTPYAFQETLQHYRDEAQTGSTQEGGDYVGARLQELATAALAEDAHRLMPLFEKEPKTLLIVFDTFEAIEQNPALVALQPGHLFPDTYQFPTSRILMAGRNKLYQEHPNWQGREKEVRSMALPPFNPQEMLAYIQAETIYSDAGYQAPEQEDQIQTLYDQTEGRPILVGLVTDVLNNRICTLDELISVSKKDFEKYLVQQINRLENPINWVILFMAHVYHRFNLTILAWIVSQLKLKEDIHEISREQLTVTLPHLSFVRYASSGGDFVLHDEMRRLVNKYCWPTHDSELRFRKSISECMITYYEREIKATTSDQVRQACIIEILYHRLYINIADGLTYFTQNFQKATVAGKTIFARLLLQDALSFLDKMSPAQRNDIQYTEARLLREEDKPEAALELLDNLSLNAEADWFAVHKASLLREKGRCYRRQGKLRDAESCYLQALQIERASGNEITSASLLSLLGETCRRRGQFQEALDYYEEALALYRKHKAPVSFANVLTRMSIVYRLQGKIEEALRRCKFGWRIRLDLFHAGLVSERIVGLSLSSLGQIYLSAGNINESEKCFRQAYDIYQRENDKASLVVTYNRLGQVELAKGELEHAQNWFEKARASSQIVDAEQYINSLNKLGRIYITQHRLEEAIAFFKEAISYAVQTFDNYQHVECLIDLGRAFIEQGHIDQALQNLKQAEDIALQENYFQLLGVIEYTRGGIPYRAEQYAEAFQHFVLYCHHMANFNKAQYNVAVRRVVDALLGIPGEARPGIIIELETYWKAHRLDKDYPELLDACEEMSDLTFPS